MCSFPCVQWKYHVPACLAGPVTCMVSFGIGLPSESLCVASLNEPRRSRPRSRAAVRQWGRYLCWGTTSLLHQPSHVRPLRSTSVVRNRLGSTNVGHKITLTWSQQWSGINRNIHMHTASKMLWVREWICCNAWHTCNKVLCGLCTASQWNVVQT